MFANAKRRRRARQVLIVGEIAAVGSLVPLLDRLPVMTDLLKGREAATWDFFGTVAAVGSGMYLAYSRCIPKEEVPATEKAVARVLNEWDSQGYQAYSDFWRFVNRSIKGGLKPELAAGAWVLWNIKGSEPSERELEAGAVIGSMLFSSMDGAWA